MAEFTTNKLMGDAIYAKLDEALKLLNNVTIEGDVISLKQ